MHPEICWTFGFTRPCMSPSDWAAWAQAIAATVAILIAVAVPAYQRWRQRKDELITAGNLRLSMAGALLGGLSVLRTEARLLRSHLDELEWSQAVAELPPDSFEPGPEFNAFRANFHLLGSTGRELNTALANTKLLRMIVLEARRLGSFDGSEAIKARLITDQVLGSIDRCMRELQAMGGITETPFAD